MPSDSSTSAKPQAPSDYPASEVGDLAEASDVARQPREVVGFYSRVGRLFEVWGRVVDSRARARVQELCAVADGEAVLEVGVGTGSQLVGLARANPSGRTVGVDLADGMINESRRRLSAAGITNAEVLRAGACDLPFVDDSFDLVCSIYVLDILPWDEIRSALTEFRRVLRPGGRLVLCHVTPGERRRHRIGDRLYGSGLPLTGNCRGIRLTSLLKEYGFAQVIREYGAQLLMPSEIVSARAPVRGYLRPR
ncbi:MAG: class I SAM-dependent methyltransferase [Actinomycetota bacterium]